MFSVIGLPVLANLVVVSVVTQLMRKQVLDNHEIHEMIRKQLKEIKIPNLSLKDVIPSVSIEDAPMFLEKVSERMRSMVLQNKKST